MKLSRLLAGFCTMDASMDCEVTGLSIDSRQIMPGDLFIALPGKRTAGQYFIEEAVSRGASAVISSIRVSQTSTQVLMIPELVKQVGEIAARYYGHPAAISLLFVWISRTTILSHSTFSHDESCNP